MSDRTVTNSLSRRNNMGNNEQDKNVEDNKSPKIEVEVAVDEHGWPKEAYNIQEDTFVLRVQDDPANTRRVLIIIVASVLVALIATVIASTI